MNTPDHLRQTGYRNPNDGRDGPFQAAFDCQGEGIFTWLTKPENAEHWDATNSFFEGDRGSRPSWVTWFPVQEKLIDGSRPDFPLLVDVAGGRGHDLIEFHDRFPDAGTLVLQDQQPVLDDAESLPVGIEKQKFDFFAEPPVKGKSLLKSPLGFIQFGLLTLLPRCSHILLEVHPARLAGSRLPHHPPKCLSSDDQGLLVSRHQ